MKNLLIFLLMLLSQFVAAQDTPPIVHDVVFSDDVEFVSREPIVDNVNRKLSLFYNDAWITIPYPDALGGVSIIERRSEAIYWLFTGAALWEADALTKTLAPIQSPCANEDSTIEWDAPYWGGWLQEYDLRTNWVYTRRGNDLFFCHLWTGELSAPLPPEFTHDYLSYDQAVFLSPDARFLIGLVEKNYHNIRVYSYEIATHTFRRIGDTGMLPVPHINVRRWLDNTKFMLIADDSHEWSWRYAYVGDITQPNSLHFAAEQYRYSPRIVAEEATIETMTGFTGEGFMREADGPDSCLLRVYDITTQAVTKYSIKDLCEFGLLIPDGSGDRLYRRVLPDGKNAELVRINHVTGTSKRLFVGEVELLGDWNGNDLISPDGHYALIEIDDSGAINMPQGWMNFTARYYQPKKYHILDLTDGTLHGMIPYSSYISWWSNTQLIDYDYNSESPMLFLIEDDVITMPIPAGYIMATDPTTQRLFLHTETNGILIYDVAAQTITPFITDLGFYRVDIQPSQNGDWQVFIASDEGGYNSMTWTVEVRLE